MKSRSEVAAGRSLPQPENGADVSSSYAGARLTVTLGMQKFSPVSFHTFDVGPYVLEFEPNPSESLSEAYARARIELEAIAEREFEVALKSYLERVKRSRDARRDAGLRSGD